MKVVNLFKKHYKLKTLIHAGVIGNWALETGNNYLYFVGQSKDANKSTETYAFGTATKYPIGLTRIIGLVTFLFLKLSNGQ